MKGLGRSLSGLLLAAVLILSLAVAVQTFHGGIRPARAQTPIVLTFWCSPHPTEAGWAIQVTRAWNATHPSIQVHLQAFPVRGVPEAILREAISRRQTPDVCAHLFPLDVHDYVRGQGLLPVDQFPDLMDAIRNRSGEAILEALRAQDGHLYQVPWKCNPILFQYNTGLLKRYGLGIPRTYAQFLNAAAVVARRSGGRTHLWALTPSKDWWYRYYDFYPLYLAATGGGSLVDAQGRPVFHNPRAVEVLEFLSRIYRGKLVPSDSIRYGPDMEIAFIHQRVAAFMTGPWSINITRDSSAPSLRFGYGPIPLPHHRGGPVQAITYANFRNIGIFSTCQHPQEAAEFVRFLIQPQNDALFLKSCSETPFRTDLLSDSLFRQPLKKDPHLEYFARYLPLSRPMDNSPRLRDALKAISEAYEACVVQGAKPADQALAEAQAKMEGGSP